MAFRQFFGIGLVVLGIGLVIVASPSRASAGTVRTFTFGYDQPADTVYGFAGGTFDRKLAELSAGTLRIKQFPNAALGSDADMAQKVRMGDIDFSLSATANTATFEPQAGVFSLHCVFADEAHLEKSVNDAAINALFKQMIAEKVTGARSLGLMTLGMRNMYAKFPIAGLADVVGKKVRVQATKTEDAVFSQAYKAIPVHMPFGQVFVSLQTGLVQIAENGADFYLKAKHYEAAPVLSKTEHEGIHEHLWISQKTWDSLTDDQKKWVLEAVEYTRPLATKKALELEALAVKTLQGLGVKWNEQVDKKSLSDVAIPLQDAQAKELGPYAVQFLGLFRDIK